MAKYPWDQCIREQTARYGSEATARKVCGRIRALAQGKALKDVDPDDVSDLDLPEGFNLETTLAQIEAETGYQPADAPLPTGAAEKTLTLLDFMQARGANYPDSFTVVRAFSRVADHLQQNDPRKALIELTLNLPAGFDLSSVLDSDEECDDDLEDETTTLTPDDLAAIDAACLEYDGCGDQPAMLALLDQFGAEYRAERELKKCGNAKYKRCVEQVKQRGGKYNPYAVCSAVLGGKSLKTALVQFAALKVMPTGKNLNTTSVQQMINRVLIGHRASTYMQLKKDVLGTMMPSPSDTSAFDEAIDLMQAQGVLVKEPGGLIYLKIASAFDPGVVKVLEALESAQPLKRFTPQVLQDALTVARRPSFEAKWTSKLEDELTQRGVAPKALPAYIPHKTDLIASGSALKALPGGRVIGCAILFTSAKSKDLTGDYFTNRTLLDWEGKEKRTALYHHGMDDTLKRARIGSGWQLDHVDEVGVWVKNQLDMRDEYEVAIYGMTQAKKLGLSSGTASHMVERAADGELKAWPIVEISFTPTPAESRTVVMPLKSIGVVPTFRQIADELKIGLKQPSPRPVKDILAEICQEVETYAEEGVPEIDLASTFSQPLDTMRAYLRQLATNGKVRKIPNTENWRAAGRGGGLGYRSVSPLDLKLKTLLPKLPETDRARVAAALDLVSPQAVRILSPEPRADAQPLPIHALVKSRLQHLSEGERARILAAIELVAPRALKQNLPEDLVMDAIDSGPIDARGISDFLGTRGQALAAADFDRLLLSMQARGAIMKQYGKYVRRTAPPSRYRSLDRGARPSD